MNSIIIIIIIIIIHFGKSHVKNVWYFTIFRDFFGSVKRCSPNG